MALFLLIAHPMSATGVARSQRMTRSHSKASAYEHTTPVVFFVFVAPPMSATEWRAASQNHDPSACIGILAAARPKAWDADTSPAKLERSMMNHLPPRESGSF